MHGYGRGAIFGVTGHSRCSVSTRARQHPFQCQESGSEGDWRGRTGNRYLQPPMHTPRGRTWLWQPQRNLGLATGIAHGDGQTRTMGTAQWLHQLWMVSPSLSPATDEGSRERRDPTMGLSSSLPLTPIAQPSGQASRFCTGQRCPACEEV